MKKVWMWIGSHKLIVLLGLTILAALSLIFVDVDGIADDADFSNNENIEVVEMSEIEQDSIICDSI